MLLLIKKHIETLIDRLLTKPQETIELRLKKQKETFSFNPPINLGEERKWLLAVTSFEAINSVFSLIGENKIFLISTPGQRSPEGSGENIDKVNELLEFRSQSDLELHV